ncbi:diguanylate cyclase [Alkalibacter rhizosphaerae]|uniref:Diguanylate cyclase n=1 Tax=Alkalibacter rhizosphaerae TaxID=2815577 RepID=A0A974XIR5_9FIRM|nr:diguanylate cyclase [Alkalibacter rhizosphaerae]
MLPSTSKQEVRRIVERILDGVDELEIKGKSASVAAGYGVKTLEDESIQDILSMADKQMYRKKQDKQQ